MDFANFSRFALEFGERLRKIPEEQFPPISNYYSTYFDYIGEIQLMAARIEKNVEDYQSYVKKIIALGDAVYEHPDLLEEFGNNFTAMRLDIKDFFIHTRIFLDALAGMIQFSYHNTGRMPPNSMNKLLARIPESYSDNFFVGLKEEMKWFSELKKRRDDIVHVLGSMVHTNTVDGRHGFEIINKHHQTWGSKTVVAVEDVLKCTVEDITGLIEYLTVNLNLPEKEIDGAL